MSVSRRRFLNWGVLAAGATVSAFGQRGIRPDHSGDASNTLHPIPPVGTQHPGLQPPPAVPPAGSPHPGLQHMTRESFLPHVGSGFKVSRGSSQPIWIRLIAAQEFPTDPSHDQAIKAASAKKTTTYMLRFLGSSTEVLRQGIYTLEHDKLGTFKLMLVPSGDGQQLYAAVITHLQ
jgi:hypothetical protein